VQTDSRSRPTRERHSQTLPPEGRIAPQCTAYDRGCGAIAISSGDALGCHLMNRLINRPFFSGDVLIIAGLVIVGGLLISQGLATVFYKLLF
jgi:hypothetical protein